MLPVIETLAGKGMPLGAPLAFTMAVTALTAPEAILLRSVMKPQLPAAIHAVMSAGIVTAWPFNAAR